MSSGKLAERYFVPIQPVIRTCTVQYLICPQLPGSSTSQYIQTTAYTEYDPITHWYFMQRAFTDFLLPKDPNKHLLKICYQSPFFLLTCFDHCLDMDRITTHACALPLVHYMLQCHPDFQTPHPVLEARQQTAPDGQVLPEWLTWSPVRKRRDQAYDSTRLPSMDWSSRLEKYYSFPSLVSSTFDVS